MSQFILPPGQLDPRGGGGKLTAVGLPPGGKLSRDILTPTLVIFTPGGQAVQAGLSCPPQKIRKHFFITFCNFSAKQQEINIILQSFKEKIMSDLHFGGIDYWGQAVQGGLSCPPSEY